MRATGFAIVEKGGNILVNTVADTERAAKVNWLVAHCGVTVLHRHTDNDIERFFEVHSKRGQLVRCWRMAILPDPYGDMVAN